MSQRTSILLVEDDRFIALALRMRLQAHGFHVTRAADFAKAVEAVAQAYPQVAVVDINLPNGNGLELMSTLHALRPDKPLPTIIMTASKSQGLGEKALQMGAVGFLEKPFPSAELIQMLDSIPKDHCSGDVNLAH